MNRQLENESISARQLATNVAESMSGPATALLGYCELLLQNAELDSNVRADLGVIRDYAKKTVDVVDRLWTFSGRRYHRPSSVRVLDLWLAISTELRASLTDRFELKVSSCDASSTAIVDRTSLERGILSLASNALGAMSKNGRLVIDISETTVPPSAELSFSSEREVYSVAEIRVSGLATLAQRFLDIGDPLFKSELAGSERTRETGICSFYEDLQDAGAIVDSSIAPNGDVRFQIFLKLLNKPDSQTGKRSTLHPPRGEPVQATDVTLLRGPLRMNTTL